MSSWLSVMEERGLRSELKVAPQIDQVTGNDLLPAWRKWKRKRRGDEGGGREDAMRQT